VSERLAVLVMAYGTPRSLDEVESYYTDIRRGRPPPPDLLEELTARYRAIGGRSPLLEITSAQARGIEERLGVRAYIGQKHAAPFIADAIEKMRGDGVERAVGLVLAPHYSSMSVGDYARRAERAAAELSWAGKLDMVESWHLEPGYLELLDERVHDARAQLPKTAPAGATVIFSAHSLPERIVASGDPYPSQLAETAAAVAKRAGLESWRVAWQSAGRTDDPWLGPDILEVIVELADAGTSGVVLCPCGFVSDHLEVLYDIDIEAARLAAKLDLPLVRTASPNDDPKFLDTLAAVAARRLHL
jgi:protoporphyrin/coproporphyrin ferrochelatase